MPDSAGLHMLACPPSQLLAAACRHIAAAHEHEIPDLTRPILLVPHLQARQAVARALRMASGAAVILLPQITTLRQWADEVPLEQRIMPAAAREAMLYQALAQRRWFEQADLWAIAGELAGLFDELTRWHVGMPASVDDFERQLERAYRAKAGASFAFEARLVHELWHALGRVPGQLDPEAAYQLRLNLRARAVDSPIYAIGLDGLAPSERQFLEACGARVPVVCFSEEFGISAAMSVPERTLASAWPEDLDVTLKTRAQALAASNPQPALTGAVSFFGAHGTEQEAKAAALVIRRWLQRGCRSIGVVVLDRIAARRARALLERSQILARDEAGWAFSTTSAATVISRWFDACGNDFHYRDLLDLLKSPFVFYEWSRDVRQQAVWRLERSLRRANVRAGLERYMALAEAGEDGELRQVLSSVRRAARTFDQRRRKTLGGWLEALDASLQEMGVLAGFDADAAGHQLLHLLQSLRADLGADSSLVAFAEFRRWLGRCLENATFRDSGIDSPVVFTSLQASRMRQFDAVLVIGADAVHLGGGGRSGLFFNQSVRRELGLPGHAEDMREVERQLFSLLANVAAVCVTWQRTSDGQPNLLAPAFERLRTLHALAWQDALDDDWLASALAREARIDASELPATLTARPAPRAQLSAVPPALSASAYNALMACPYQFFARYVLRLREEEDVQQALLKSDYGSRIHEILHRFHSTHPRVCDLTPEAGCAALERVSREAFADAIAADYIASAWLLRWLALVPHYVQWQREREMQGWCFRAGEIDRVVTIATPAGRQLQLRGRIDRVDARVDGTVAVVDYKTQRPERLAGKLRARGEDVQLPVYALLWGEPVAEALFLSVDRDEVCPIPHEAGIDVLADEVRARIGELFDRICEGAPLPAQGVDEACRYCELSGLCRRKHWS